MQGEIQRVPLDHDLIACGGRGSGKSFGGQQVIARDSTVLKEKLNSLIQRWIFHQTIKRHCCLDLMQYFLGLHIQIERG